MGIKDESHQRAILVCVDELCQRSSRDSSTAALVAASAALTSGNHTEANSSSSHHHRLTESSFPSLERCDKCHKFLRGLLHQGLICHCNWPTFITHFFLFFFSFFVFFLVFSFRLPNSGYSKLFHQFLLFPTNYNRISIILVHDHFLRLSAAYITPPYWTITVQCAGKVLSFSFLFFFLFKSIR